MKRFSHGHSQSYDRTTLLTLISTLITSFLPRTSSPEIFVHLRVKIDPSSLRTDFPDPMLFKEERRQGSDRLHTGCKQYGKEAFLPFDALLATENVYCNTFIKQCRRNICCSMTSLTLSDREWRLLNSRIYLHVSPSVWITSALNCCREFSFFLCIDRAWCGWRTHFKFWEVSRRNHDWMTIGCSRSEKSAGHNPEQMLSHCSHTDRWCVSILHQRQIAKSDNRSSNQLFLEFERQFLTPRLLPLFVLIKTNIHLSHEGLSFQKKNQ
jgi:hypothetical protein